LVYYTPSEGILTLYISTIDNNATEPGESSSWEVTVDNPQPPIINSSGLLSFNTTYWTLQTWDSAIIYMKNYMVYYPLGTQTLYISLKDNNSGNTPSDSSSSYWTTTSL
jgi:hypothetical protein